MVASELGVSPDDVSQEEIDAAMLKVLSEPEVEKSGKKKSPVKKQPSKRNKTADKAPKASVKKEETITKLKTYIFKCGVRRQWKRELQGLTTNQVIDKLETILKELGMEGTTTTTTTAFS